MMNELHRKLLGSVAVVAIAAATTTATSQPVDAGGLMPPPHAVDDPWSGFYVGGHLGEGRSDFHGFWATAPGSTFADFSQFADSGLAGGMHVGYNHVLRTNWGSFLAGVEGDATALGLHSCDTQGDRNIIPGGSGQGCANVDHVASLRGRLGLALGPVMGYGTLGWGWAEANAYLGSSTSGQSFDFQDNALVWGFGAEYLATPHLVVGIEYMQYEFDDRQGIVFEVTTARQPDNFLTFDDVSLFRARVSYKH